MNSKIEYTNSKSIADLEAILLLQRENHYSNISKKEAKEQGFVTCIHDAELLSKMNQPFPHIIAKDQNRIVAYALVMTREHSSALPVLQPMFEKINSLDFQGIPLNTSAYVVMGQICVAKEYRGKGIFKELYNTMELQLRDDFDYIITEVDEDNRRSLAAHARCGFTTIAEYNSVKDWHLVLKEIGANR